MIIEVHFRQLLPPAKFSRDFPGTGVVIAFYEEDVLATDSLPVSQRVLARSTAEITEEVKEIALCNYGVEPIDDADIHVGDVFERPVAISDDIHMAKMKIRGEPDV